jgi:uncharacterized protein YhjY with autotransporter beta-barrel domain
LQLEGLGQLKNLVTSLGFKPMTFQLVESGIGTIINHKLKIHVEWAKLVWHKLFNKVVQGRS